MAQNSNIEWTDHTANLWWGCERVHAGCDNCYAEALAHRRQTVALWNQPQRLEMKGVWNDLFAWQRKASADGRTDRVFVGSMMDIGEKSIALVDRFGKALEMNTGELRDRFYNNYVDLCPNLLFLLLSKRPSNYPKQVPGRWLFNPRMNVMYGTSIAQNDQLATLLIQLKRMPGYRFLSLEPQLENIPKIDLSGIDWVIQGGESGPRKRPFDTDWARSMRDECARQNVPYFFKQIDKVQEIPDDLKIRQFPVLNRYYNA